MRLTLEWQEALDVPTDWEKPLRATVSAEGEPVVELELSGWNGHVTAVTVREEEGVVSRDLRIPLDRYLDLLTERFGWRYQPTAPPRRKGRRLSDEFLLKVASAYRAAGNHVSGINETVDPEFYGAVDSTKFRWLKAARERGILTGGDDDGER